MADTAALLQSLLGAITSKSSSTTGASESTTSGTSGSTTTTKGNIDKAGMDLMIQDILAQAGSGVADIATGSKVAGIYDSTTQGFLTGNLIARTAGELAKAQAGTTTTTTGTKEDTVKGTQTGNANVESPLRNIDFSALAGAGGLGLLAQVLGPSLQGGVNAATGGLGISGAGEALRNLLFPSQAPMIGLNQTSGAGIGQIGSSQLTPQQLEALLNNTGGFDISSYLDPNVGSADFWSSIGIDPNSITADNSGGVGDWWDPNWLP